MSDWIKAIKDGKYGSGECRMHFLHDDIFKALYNFLDETPVDKRNNDWTTLDRFIKDIDRHHLNKE